MQGEALIPTDWGPFLMKAYSMNSKDPMPHLVLIKQPLDTNLTVNVRIHSECITGDLFRSNRCECGEQLYKSLDYISENGGVLIYLRQEGRGIGIINKLHAYEKQDEGFDTAEANRQLGFHADNRNYSEAIHVLHELNITNVNLLTNNPDKVSAFENTGINIVSRIPIQINPKVDNLGYLKAKRDIFGHFLDV